MLPIYITSKNGDFYDEINDKYIKVKDQVLNLEHSLLSISKWEAKYKKCFLDNVKNLTDDEYLYYIQCMTINQNVDPDVYYLLSKEQMDKINHYINDPQSAVYFYNELPEEGKGKNKNSNMTSERIYSMMVLLNIPSEYQKWHLNRLINVIKFCQEANQPPKKVSKKDIMRRNEQENARRRAMWKSKG